MAALSDITDAMACEGCGERYPVLNGRPLLLAGDARRRVETFLATDDGQRMVREYDGRTDPVETGSRGGWLRRLKPPGVMLRYRENIIEGPAGAMFERKDGEAPLVLNVGGGPHRLSAEEITLNIGPFPNVDLIADGHAIPVADDTFDAVFSLAVLEHVPDAPRVVAEMTRVLRPGGYLYSEVPFMWFYHGYPSDYQRYTLSGMKRLFAALEEPSFGMTHGPVSAALQAGNMALQLLVPARPRALRKAFNGAYRMVFFPFKYLDLVLRDRPDAHTVAGGFYVLGRKPGARARA
jgi:SAM-dependent methyltransferase